MNSYVTFIWPVTSCNFIRSSQIWQVWCYLKLSLMIWWLSQPKARMSFDSQMGSPLMDWIGPGAILEIGSSNWGMGDKWWFHLPFIDQWRASQISKAQRMTLNIKYGQGKVHSLKELLSLDWADESESGVAWDA